MTLIIRKKTLTLIILLAMSACTNIALSQIDSLYDALSRAGNDTVRINCCLELSGQYAQTGQSDSALRYAEMGLELSKKTNTIPDIDFYLIMIRVLDHRGDYGRSVKLLPLIIDILKESKYPADEARMLNYNGWLNMRTASFKEAVADFEEAIRLAREMNLPDVEADANLGTGRVYYNLHDYALEEMYYERYLELVDWEEERHNVSNILSRLGDIKRENGRIEEGIEVYMQLAGFAGTDGDTLVIANALNRASWGYYELGRLEEALDLYLKDLAISRKLGHKGLIANCLGNIGNIYRDWNYFEKAIEYYTLSIEAAKEIGDMYNLSWLHQDISRMYANMGRYELAYENFVLHAAYNDSLQSESYRLSLLNAQAQYAIEKGEHEIELMQVRLQRNNYLIYGISGLSLLVVIIALLFIRTNHLRSRERLEAMHHKVSDLTQKNLRSQMNPHFIFNTLNSIQYYIFQNDRIASNDYLTKFAKLIRKTLENSEHPAIPIHEEINALELYLELESLRFKNKFTWSVNIDEDIDTLMYKIPTMLIQPFVENSIGHGLMHKEGQGRIIISLKLGQECINCCIEDNGIGRKKAMEIKNGRNENHVSLGTSITESRLKLVNSLYGKNMKIEYTDLVNEKGDACGTRVEICIPIIT